MKKIILALIIFIIICFTLNYSEPFMILSDGNITQNNIDIRGNLELDHDINRLRLNKVCSTIQHNGEAKSFCLDKGTVGVMKDMANARKSHLCLGNTCINQDHLKILKGESPFLLNTNIFGSQVLTHSTLSYGTETNFYIEDSTNYHFSAQPNGTFEFNRPWKRSWEHFRIQDVRYTESNGAVVNKIGIKTAHNKFLYPSFNGDIGVTDTLTNTNMVTLERRGDQYSFKNIYGKYLSSEDRENPKWDKLTPGTNEKFRLTSIGTNNRNWDIGKVFSSQNPESGGTLYIYVGNSNTNTKTVTLTRSGLTVNPEPANRQESHWRDTFRTSVSGNTLTVTRTDSSGGWGQNLILSATTASNINPNQQFYLNNISNIPALNFRNPPGYSLAANVSGQDSSYVRIAESNTPNSYQNSDSQVNTS